MSDEQSNPQQFGETQTLADGLASPLFTHAGRSVALLAQHAGGVQSALLAPDAPLTVGRTAPACLRIEDPTLSREHARFTLSGGRVRVEDLGSRNGTRIVGRRVKEAELEIGDEVHLGGVLVRIQALGATGEPLGIEGEDRLRRYIEEELTRAEQFRGPFALLFVRAVHAESAGAEDRPWIETLRARLRPVDRIALYGLDAAQVLLPETGADNAARIARAIAAPSGGSVSFLVGGAVHPDAGSTAEVLIERAREAARRASPTRPVELVASSSWAIEGTGDGALVAGAAMRELLATIERVAASRIPIVLHGETGTGKEVLARLIHDRGPRKARRMVRVNCGAIPKELVESTLFGHERGAFTGALQQQKGVFEDADGGTVFLDEIGELPPAAQAALLRVLETGSFSRVGSPREIETDVRIVAATHRDLEAMCETGAFRADLYYRLGGVVIDIPPLRERKDEIEPLAWRFLRGANEANGRSVQGIAREALELLQLYNWPGNVRELRNAIERAVVVTRGALVGPEDLPARVRAARAEGERTSDTGRVTDPGRVSSPEIVSEAPLPSPEPPGVEGAAVRGKVQQYEAKILRDTLEAAGWNRNEAAKRLGIPVRTLSYRMKVLGVTKPGT
ncbi:sigma 54-interacting transcriptional regulator [Polyangium aurulentum]|uniref:sigma 54-interacting transcriptional regulator n=1 Tax=Polyangium aurulentum TaxID=2567896 RepID=UPI0010AE842B|nr:sigma 54-interacting transcriptional regulator [Polyangium aurulentum]UQA57519.1 sigma 54-interacting transcriptional regulator [Polyangium aurulentum]